MWLNFFGFTRSAQIEIFTDGTLVTITCVYKKDRNMIKKKEQTRNKDNKSELSTYQ